MKKLAVLSLTISLVGAGSLSAAGEAESSDLYSDDLGLSSPGVYPIVEGGPERLSVFIRRHWKDTLCCENFMIYELMTDITNVELEFQVTTANAFYEVLNLAISSGDSFDVVANHSRSLPWLWYHHGSFIHQGIIKPLNDVIHSHSVYYKEALENIEGVLPYATGLDGNIYMLTRIQGTDRSRKWQNVANMWINQVWLDNLDLDLPSNVDEFYDVMLEFKNLDANGNGDPTDEWPLATLAIGSGVEIDGFLMNPFQHTTVSPANVKRWVVEDDGVVTPAFVQPGYRAGLRYIRRLWEDELIYPDFIQSLTEARELNVGSDSVAIFGAMPAQHAGYLGVSLDDGVQIQYVALPALEGPAGRQSATGLGCCQPGPLFTSDDPRKIAIAMKYFDWMYSDEGAIIGSFGINESDPRSATYGAWWKDPPPGALTEAGAPATVEMLPTPNKYRSEAGPLLNWNRPSGLREQGGASEELAYLQSVIDEFVAESVIRFIVGDLDIESDWDWYLDELDKKGLHRAREIWQTNYEQSDYYSYHWQ